MRLDIKMKQLVGSRTRAKLIKLFFCKPTESFYVRQLVRMSGEEINSVRRELANMNRIGLVLAEKKSNKLYYRPNFRFAFFNELVLIAFKSNIFWTDLYKYGNNLGDITRVICSKKFVFGNNEGEEGDIDIVIIGKVNVDKISKIVSEEEKRRAREINYMVMTKKEFELRISRRDPFMVDFFLKTPITIIGNYG